MPYKIKGGFSTADPKAMEKIAKAMGKKVSELMPVGFTEVKDVKSTMASLETFEKEGKKVRKKAKKAPVRRAKRRK